MKKFIIFLFFYLFSFNALSSDQFTFDVTEIEILENGNKIIGKKRGSIETDNGIIFNADEFIYYKKLNLLNAKGGIKVLDKINKYIIYTDEINYNKNKDTIVSKKNSKAINQKDNIEITAENFEYDRKQNIIIAEKNVFLNDKNQKNEIYSEFIKFENNKEKISTLGKTFGTIQSKYNFNSSDIIFDKNNGELISKKEATISDENNLYKLVNFIYSINKSELKGNKILIETNYNSPKSDKFYFSSAIINLKDLNFIGKDTEITIHKDIFDNSKNDPRLKGVSSQKKGELTIVNKGVFTSCGKNENCPPWSINAEKITHDKKNKKLIYDNAILKIFDLPVLYFPKFFHPDPTVTRQSGFLKPQISNSNILGNSLNVPYFHVISDNKDLTFSPTRSSKETTILQTEYRQENNNSSFIADIGLVNKFKSKYSNENKNIMHLFMKSEIDLSLNNFSNSKLDIYFEKTNKDTYLKIFDSYLMNNKIKPKNKNVLSSGIDLKLSNDKFSLETGFSAFEDLNKKQNDRYQYILPYYRLNSSFNNNYGTININSNGNNILQETNNLRTRIINDLNFSSQDILFSETGFKSNFNIYLKNINTLAKKDAVYKSSAQSEIMSLLETNTSYPLIKNSNNVKQKLTPKLSLRVNPGDMRKNANVNRTINTNNIFAIDRLGLEDNLEGGKSLTAGIDYTHSNFLNNDEIQLKLAKVIRDEKESDIPKNTSLNRKKSYLFGSFEYEKSDYLNLNYNFATEDTIDDVIYHDLGLSISLNNFVTDFNFIKESDDYGSIHILENKSTYNFSENSFVSFRTRRNEELNLTEYYDLIYEYKYDCLVAGLKYNKSYYQDRELEPSEELFFSITIVPLTNWDQEIDSELYN